MTGSRILITGASSGIGRDTAVLLDSLGARLILAGRSTERIEQTRALLQNPDTHIVSVFDLNRADDIPGWMASHCKDAGPLDGIVHAAGKQVTMPVRSLTAAAVDDLVRTNLTSSLMLVRGALQKPCRKPGGSIVLISSVMGMVSKPGISLYSATKSALHGAVRSLALELARDHIRINCIAPAFVATSMLEQIRETMLPGQFAELEAAHPLGFGTPRDVASAAAFLLSGASRWITGTTLVADGGYSCQ